MHNSVMPHKNGLFVFRVTWLSTNFVVLSNRSADDGKVKLLLLLDKTEPASKTGSSRKTRRDMDLARSSLGFSPTSVRDKIVLPTSSRDCKIPMVRSLDLNEQTKTVRKCSNSKVRLNVWAFFSSPSHYTVLHSNYSASLLEVRQTLF